MIFEERQIEKNNFSSRAILLFGIVVLSLIAVLVQVFSLQISGYNDYQLAALKNKNYAVPVQALRGEIFDRSVPKTRGYIFDRSLPKTRFHNSTCFIFN